MQSLPDTLLPSRLKIIQHDSRFSGFSYYEYKYEVSHNNLDRVHKVLNEFAGNTDPFPSGIVDSIYYDTPDEKILLECMNGEVFKSKFRIRGYGDGRYHQLHQKFKELNSVSKYKCGINPENVAFEYCPDWNSISAKNEFDPEYRKIMFNGRKYGPLYPSIRVKYFRYRFRAYDYRITLDTNIEVFTPVNGLPRTLSYAVLPHHVLEVKTTDLRPKLPFIGIIQLPQISFSKFMIGLNLLKAST